MKLNRRLFLGAFAAGTAGLVSPRAFAAVKSAERPDLLPRAMAALDSHRAKIASRDLIGIVDFSARSGEPRFHFVDVANGRVATSLFVSHGRGSDPQNSGWVQQFSNRPGSNASSNGSYLTGNTYYGKHGRSRRLEGLDPENNNAFQRAIVIHGASYVSRDMAHTQGRVGRSQGCFAVSRSDIGEVLDRLGPGHLLFAAK
ncbi:twin-arginine translocation pathway signal protein [Croceicoccus estronivorus]|uniref:murein L,D-transpeptidase catalytic domain family protein n=1 Tax=Croceicoccus estronivorus TaxID=1172626 RepID=UPI0008354D20|nr:murein L,D-transpeptidase catalytic domain family protein [Croceicoccus estronivorus]OCC25398.1 twin-arginine translocation pathway signal protein [Croceicoccus estronivorus]